MHVRLIDLKREYELCMILSEKAKLSNDVYALAFAYTFISDFYLASKKNKDCIRYLERARKLCESTEYTELLARIYNFYGMYYNSNYEEIKALEAYLKSMEAAEKCQNLTLMSSAYNNIATCFELKRNYTEAIHYYKKCYELLQSMEKNSAYSKAIVLSNLCNCEYRLKDAAALCAYFSRFEDLDRQSFEESMNLLYLFCKLMYLRLHEAVSVQAVMEELLQAYREFYTIILTIEDTDMEDNSSGLTAALELYRTKERQVSLEKENEQLERLMNIDDLTNIYNRRCFNEDITATDLQKEKIVAVAMLDMTVLIRQADEQLYQHKKLRRQRCKHADAVTGNVQ